jgi:hypothetical protein
VLKTSFSIVSFLAGIEFKFWKERDNLRGFEVDGKIILKCAL